jgi:peptide/nickel transport system substrate-binding protein
MRTIVCRLATIFAALILLLPLTAWANGSKEQGTTKQAAAASGQSLPRNETLYIGGFQWGPPTNFNPISSNPAWPMGGNGGSNIQADGYVYETLFIYNILNGTYKPLLGKSMDWTSDTQLTIHLQPGTKWQDGTPLTAKDVVFTFDLAKKFSLGYSTFWDYVSSVTAPNDQTVQIDLKKANRGFVLQYIAYVYILPQHIWGPIAAKGQSALLQATNFDPVGSGPYKVKSHSAQQIVLEQTGDYWGSSIYGDPTPKYLVHPIFKSNDDGNLALKQGQLDWSQQFIPNVFNMKNVATWYNKRPYYVPGSIPFLFLNTKKPGLNNVLVRKAIAYAINYPLIPKVAVTGYSQTAESSVIIPTGVESKYFDKQNVEQYGWKYDPQKAIDILQNQLHATKGSDGIYVLPDGTKMSFTAETPYGWTDWMAALQVVSQSAKAAGIQINAKFPQAPIVTSNVQTGNFDLALWYVAGVGPASPWLRFQNVMDSKGVPAEGKTAYWDYGRFSSPQFETLLAKAAVATTEAEKKQLYAEMDKMFMQNVPAIPLMYRALDFYEFNTTHWTGFPTAANPMDSQPLWDISILRHVHPVSN